MYFTLFANKYKTVYVNINREHSKGRTVYLIMYNERRKYC